MLIQIIIDSDSTILSKMDVVIDIVKSFDKKVTINPWLPFLAAIVGGILVWIGQAIDRSYKVKQEIINEKMALFTKAEFLLLNLKNSLKELAVQKNLREYYWYCYIDEYNAPDKNEENEKKYLNDHYMACQAIVAVTIKLGEILSDYYSMASKFNVLNQDNLKFEFITYFVTATDFADAKQISANNSAEKALEEYEKNTKLLVSEYIALVEPFDVLNENLKFLVLKK